MERASLQEVVVRDALMCENELRDMGGSCGVL
jgi:hypothetical protein